jgi:hypothetical protein
LRSFIDTIWSSNCFVNSWTDCLKRSV